MRLVLCLALLCSPAWATWSLDTSFPADKTTCSGTTCAPTFTATTAHHILVAGMLFANNGVTISSVTAGACNVAWVKPTSVAVSASGKGGLDFMWCSDATGGTTTLTITSSGTTGTSVGYVYSFSDTAGTVAINSGTTPSGSASPGSCTSCAGISLTLSSNNSFCVASSAGSNTITGLTGAGWVNDLTNPLGDGVAHLLNNTSTALTAPTTWTQNATGTGIVDNAACFQETGGGGPTCTPTMALMGVGQCG